MQAKAGYKLYCYRKREYQTELESPKEKRYGCFVNTSVFNAFKTFQQFVPVKNGHFGVMSVIFANAIMASSIDPLPESFEQKASADVCCALNKTTEKKIFGKGGSVSLVSVVWFRHTVPDSTTLSCTMRFPCFRAILSLREYQSQNNFYFTASRAEIEDYKMITVSLPNRFGIQKIV